MRDRIRRRAGFAASVVWAWLGTGCASANDGGAADAGADANTGGDASGDASANGDASADAGDGANVSAEASPDSGVSGVNGCASCTAQSCLTELQGCGGSQGCLVALMDFNTCLGRNADGGAACGATFAATGPAAHTLWSCMSMKCPSCA